MQTPMTGDKARTVYLNATALMDSREPGNIQEALRLFQTIEDQMTRIQAAAPACLRLKLSACRTSLGQPALALAHVQAALAGDGKCCDRCRASAQAEAHTLTAILAAPARAVSPEAQRADIPALRRTGEPAEPAEPANGGPATADRIAGFHFTPDTGTV